jgi:hypothetical protein
MDDLRKRLKAAVEFAREVEEVRWTRGAQDLWTPEYSRLTAPRSGAFGLATHRAAPHVLRFAVLFALLNRSKQIEAAHLEAALAAWQYSEASARFVFGSSLGDRDADRILEALRAAPPGMTRHDIRRGLFGDNKSAETIAAKLGLLLRLGLVRRESSETGGRPAERWFAVNVDVKNVKTVQGPSTAPPYHVNHVYHVPPAAEDAAPDREVFEL